MNEKYGWMNEYVSIAIVNIIIFRIPLQREFDLC